VTGDGVITRPTAALVKGFLTELDIRWFLDDEGDFGGFWGGDRIFFFRGERVYTVRVDLDRSFPIEDKLRLLDLTDEWNRRYRWPKAYTVTGDDGRVRVSAESQIDCEHGLTRDYLLHFTKDSIGRNLDFVHWLLDELVRARQAQPEPD
jgi:hypothetical protein